MLATNFDKGTCCGDGLIQASLAPNQMVSTWTLEARSSVRFAKHYTVALIVSCCTSIAECVAPAQTPVSPTQCYIPNILDSIHPVFWRKHLSKLLAARSPRVIVRRTRKSLP